MFQQRSTCALRASSSFSVSLSDVIVRGHPEGGRRCRTPPAVAHRNGSCREAPGSDRCRTRFACRGQRRQRAVRPDRCGTGTGAATACGARRRRCGLGGAARSPAAGCGSRLRPAPAAVGGVGCCRRRRWCRRRGWRRRRQAVEAASAASAPASASDPASASSGGGFGRIVRRRLRRFLGLGRRPC